MWPFARTATPEEIRGHKRVTVNGMRFVIRKLNPLIDFTEDKMPQIFTSYVSRRPGADVPVEGPEAARKARESMYAVIRAGTVVPKIVQEEAKDDGVRASDLFRDPTLGPKLYIEIVSHSLNVFKGVKGLFFFHRIKLSLWTQWRRDTDGAPQKSLTPAAV
jgi:hypothetical protein